MIDVNQDPAEAQDVDWLILVVPTADEISTLLKGLEPSLNGKLERIWLREDFTGKHGETLALMQTDEISAANVMLAGAGDLARLNHEQLRRSLMTAIRQISVHPDQRVAVAFDSTLQEIIAPSELIEVAADCCSLAAVDAGVHKRAATRHALRQFRIVLRGVPDDADCRIKYGVALGTAVATVRNLVNRSASDLTPERFVEEAETLAESNGLEVKVLRTDELVTEKMDALLAVAKGSDLPPALVELSWTGNPSTSDVLGLVGKGVTFDSGGLSIKPSDSMIPMKSDMAGAATAMAAVVAAAAMKLPVNVTAWLGLVENMISGKSFRPGDVIESRRGISIEVQNTDAEGRLVLADALAYAADHGATELIDLATLTGACVVALGEEITGMFAGSDELAQQIQNAAKETGELVWPMPMHDHFDALLKSDVADCRNIGPRWGGAITAACFLRKFVEDTPWVHLDIAGPSWADSSAGWRDSGGTGAMVRTLVQLLRNRKS
jgi:leucyl aminopeptidase